MCDLKKLDKIIPSIKDGKCVLWIGSGLSRIAGCKSWDHIINNIFRTPCMQKHNLADFDSLTNPAKFFFCKQEFKKAKQESAYIAQITAALMPKEGFEEQYKPIIKAIDRLSPKAPIITTNVDSCLELTYLFKDDVRFSSVDDFRLENVKPGSVFHIHGIFEDFKSQNWDEKGYEELYGNENFSEFLKALANGYTILFLGMSFKEPEVIKFFKEKRDREHFVLLNEKEWTLGLQQYWKMYNVNFLNYGDRNNFGDIFINWINRNFIKTVSLGSEEDISHAK